MCVAMHNVTNNKDDKACGWVVVADLSPSLLFVCTVHWYTALPKYVDVNEVRRQAQLIY